MKYKTLILAVFLFFSIPLICQVKDGTFKYDNLNRLIGYKRNYSTVNYSYDENGNRVTKTANYIALPLTLVQFQAQKSLTEVLLSWKTSKEINTSFFDIEFSIDGVTFTKIATVQAKGATTGEAIYQSTHCCPISGTNYYKLKMIDKDAKFTYSPIRTVVFDNAIGMKVYPNPSKENTTLTISFSSPIKVQSSLYIYNLLGEVIRKEAVPKATVTYKVAETNFAIGEYIVVVKGGETIMTSKLVISH